MKSHLIKVNDKDFGDLFMSIVIDLTADALRASHFYDSISDILKDVDKSMLFFTEKEEYCKCAFLKLLKEELITHAKAIKKLRELYPDEDFK